MNNLRHKEMQDAAEKLEGPYGKGYSRGLTKLMFPSLIGNSAHKMWLGFNDEQGRGYRDAVHHRMPDPRYLNHDPYPSEGPYLIRPVRLSEVAWKKLNLLGAEGLEAYLMGLDIENLQEQNDTHISEEKNGQF